LAAILCLFISFSHADFIIAPNLTQLQRKLLLKTLGLGTVSKNLTSPRPLGSDSGIELAISTEIINTKQIEPVITNSQAENTLFYPKILIGKGLYESADLFFHFIPYTATLGISEFGGMVRVSLYKSTTNPFVASWNVHANSANFNNQLTTRNVGTDISLGLDWGSFAVFAGGGWATSSGKFVGGAQGITDTGFAETESVNSERYSIGMLYKYDIYDVALSLDHYVEPVYSVKLGVIF
jgi:hypothetical protein